MGRSGSFSPHFYAASRILLLWLSGYFKYALMYNHRMIVFPTFPIQRYRRESAWTDLSGGAANGN